MTLPTLGTAATAWFWETFGKDLAKTLTKDVWNTLNWAAAAQRYRQHLYKQYSQIHIFGMAEPVPLEGVFTHVVALDKPADWHRYDVTALQEEAARDPERIHALMQKHIYGGTERIDGCVLVRQPGSYRLFILGKPGAGKTTFLKYLALQAAQGDLNQIPIFVTLREWRAESDLIAFLVRQFEICAFPDAAPFIKWMLEQTDYGLVLFDGLDEIPQEGECRDRAIAAIRDFAYQYPRVQVLVTCRNAASDVTFESFKYVEVADFQDGQMYAFVRKWFKVAGASAVVEQFWQDLDKDENRGIREMGRQPLLLTLLCLTYQETLRFPQRRIEIYEEALEALLKKWDSSRQVARDSVYKGLSLGRKRQLFARLAAEFFDRGIYFIPQRDLVQVITRYVQGLPTADKQGTASADAALVDGIGILQEIEAQHGILVQCAHQVYTFAHLTFQEYYTARYIVDNARRSTLKTLSSHITEARWREVILLTASILDEADDFFMDFLDALDAIVRDDAVLVTFLNWVQRKTATVTTSYKPAAVRGYYAWLARARHLTHDLDLASIYTLTRAPHGVRDLGRILDLKLDFDFDLALTLDPDLDRDLTLDRVLYRDLNLNYDHDTALDHDCALDPDLDRALALDLDRDLAHARCYDRDNNPAVARAFANARARAKELGLVSLHQALAGLTYPARNASEKDGKVFVTQLQRIMIEYRDIGHDWDLTEEQKETLERYYKATHLLVECLDVAYVTDRSAIEERLLLPPDERSESI